MSFRKELTLLFKARYPIIYIASFEEERVEYTVRNSIQLGDNQNIYIWDFIEGYINNINKTKFASKNPLQALEFVENVNIESSSIFIFKDFNKFLNDVIISRKLKNLYRILKNQAKTIIILASEIEIPKELKNLITIIEFSLPNDEEIKSEFIRLSQLIEIKFDQKFLENLIRSSQGLSIEQIRRILSKSIVKYGSINKNTVDMILIEKRQIINQTKILEFEDSKISFKDIGGLENLKKWLEIRKTGFTTKAKLYGLPTPRGLLLTGIQGTGKSLTAKAIATEWNLPLLKLDIGKLFGGILGESENRIRKMIEVSEALAPCIIWIDEIDKAFNVQSKNSDSGTSDRVLGTFINWLSEKKSKVFVIATANNFSVLPLEIIRKGRFDEIFFIGLPNLNERKNILLVFLKRLRPKNYGIFDIQTLAQNSEGFSGAELEQSIVEAMHIAFNEKREFTNEDILQGLREIVPISQIDTKRIKQIEELALSGRIRLASKNEKSLLIDNS